MAYVVKYKGSIVAGPFSSSSDAYNARDQKAREAGILNCDMEVEYV